MNLFNRFIVMTMPLVPRFIVKKISQRYIAGTSLDAAVEKIKELNRNNIKATVDLLGEDITSREQARQNVEQYLKTLDRIHEEKLDASISLKLTAFGLKQDFDFCMENVKQVLQRAKQYDNFVRIDMEDASCTDDTIEIYFKLYEQFHNVGTVFQSYLRRTIGDIENIFSKIDRPNFRLVKGIYDEPYEIAYKDKQIIRDNFAYLMRKMLSRGAYVGIATHDEQLIWHGLRLVDELKLSTDSYEFQMLLGVTEKLRDLLVEEGHTMRLYVPYGEQWYEYSVRRLKENPKVAGYIIKNLFFPR